MDRRKRREEGGREEKSFPAWLFTTWPLSCRYCQWWLLSCQRAQGGLLVAFLRALPLSSEYFLFFLTAPGREKGVRGRETEIEGERIEEAALLQSRGRALKKCHLESLKE